MSVTWEDFQRTPSLDRKSAPSFPTAMNFLFPYAMPWRAEKVGDGICFQSIPSAQVTMALPQPTATDLPVPYDTLWKPRAGAAFCCQRSSWEAMRMTPLELMPTATATAPLRAITMGANPFIFSKMLSPAGVSQMVTAAIPTANLPRR
jgi:hypothetical protein